MVVERNLNTSSNLSFNRCILLTFTECRVFVFVSNTIWRVISMVCTTVGFLASAVGSSATVVLLPISGQRFYCCLFRIIRKGRQRIWTPTLCLFEFFWCIISWVSNHLRFSWLLSRNPARSFILSLIRQWCRCVWAVGKLQHAILIWCNCFSNAALINSGLRKRAGCLFPIRAPTHKSLFACKCPCVCAHKDYTSVFSFVLVVVEMSYCTCQSVSTVAKSLTDFQHFSNTHLKMNPDSSGWTSLMSLRVGSPCTIYSLDFLHLSLFSFCVHLTE